MGERPMMVGGMRVFILQPIPRLKLLSTFEWISDEARNEFNQWLAEMFGYHDHTNIGPKGTCIVDERNMAIYTDADTAQALIKNTGQPQ